MSNSIDHLELTIMGRPVLIEAAGADLLAAVAETYADWAAGGSADGSPIRLALDLTDDVDAAPVRIDVDGPRLRLAGAGLDGWADARSLEAFCQLPRRLADRPASLAAEVLDTLLLFLLTRSGRVPVHAAGVVCGGTALVLAGPGGAGKSTLSLAAMRRGLRILSDDTVYIQLEPRLRIWGFPRPVHVFPADADGFTQGTRLRAGKLKAVVPLSSWPGPPVADRAAVVLLRRGDAVSLEAIEPDVAARALLRLEPGFDLLAEESAQAVTALTAAGAWRLTLARDPAEAVDALMRRFGHGGRTDSPPPSLRAATGSGR